MELKKMQRSEDLLAQYNAQTSSGEKHEYSEHIHNDTGSCCEGDSCCGDICGAIACLTCCSSCCR